MDTRDTWQRAFVHKLSWDEKLESACGGRDGERERGREGGGREGGREGDSLELETLSFFFSNPRLQLLLVFVLLSFSKVN
jgi:hypothetical protein